MSKMADPTLIIHELQRTLNDGCVLDDFKIKEDLFLFKNEWQPGMDRFTFAKVVNREVVAVSIFCYDPIDKHHCYNVSYAVNEKYQGKGLAVTLVKTSLEILFKELKLKNIESFILEAIIGETNIPSIKTAKKIFNADGRLDEDGETDESAYYFQKSIKI